MLLRESVLRKIINESIKKKLLTESINSKVRSQIDLLNKKKPGWAVRIRKATLQNDLCKGGCVEIIDKSGKMIAKVSYASSKKKKAGPCGGAHVVCYTTNSGLSVNPLVYDILIELLSLAGSGLTSDKDEVSHPVFSFQEEGYAQYMWAFYLQNRPDIQKVKLDPLPFKFTKSEDDDCKGTGSFRNWVYSQNPLYVKQGGTMGYPDSKTKTFMQDKKGAGRSDYQAHDPFDVHNLTKQKNFTLKNIQSQAPGWAARYKKDWQQNKLPLMIMLKKNSYPVLQMLKSLGIAFVEGEETSPESDLTYNAWKRFDSSAQKTTQKAAARKSRKPATRNPKQSTRPDFDPDKDWEIYQNATNYGKRQLVKKWTGMGIKKAKRSWQRSDLDI